MTSATAKLVRRQKRLPNTQSSLKTFLYRMLKDTGDLDSLKSQIRQRMILELKERNQTTVHMNREIDFGREEPDMYQNLVNCLFMDHLQTSDYLYTLSVFLPECGLTNYKMLSPVEVLRILKLPNESQLLEDVHHLWTGKVSFVCRLLGCLTAPHRRSLESKDVQTEVNFFPGMDARINHIDQEYQLRRQLAVESSKASIEERLDAYRKEVAQEAKIELQRQMAEFRQLQLAQLRIEVEQQKEDAFQERRQQLEQEFRARLSSLTEREQQLQERIISVTRTEDREAFLRRQQVQTELESVQVQAAHMKDEKEQLNRERRRLLEEENRREQQLAERERKLAENERLFEIRVNQEIERLRIGEQLRLSQQKNELELCKLRLDENIKTLESEKQMVQSIKVELMEKKQKFSEIELAEYDLLKEQKDSLKKDVELLKSQLKKAQKEIEGHKGALTIAQLELDAVKTSKQELELLRTYLNNERSSFSHEKRQLQTQIDEQVKENRELSERLSRSEKEVAHLRRSLADICTGHRREEVARVAHFGLLNSGDAVQEAKGFPITDSESSSRDSPLNLKMRPQMCHSRSPQGTQADYWAKRLEEARQRMAKLQCESERLETVYERWRASKWGEASTMEPQETYGIYSTPLTGPTSSISWHSQLPVRSTLSGLLLPTSYVQEFSTEKPSKSSMDTPEQNEREPSGKPSQSHCPPDRDTTVPPAKEPSTASMEPTGPVSHSPNKSLPALELRDSMTTTRTPAQSMPSRQFSGNEPHMTERLTSISSSHSVNITRKDASQLIGTPQNSACPKPTSTPDIGCTELTVCVSDRENASSPSSSESRSDMIVGNKNDYQHGVNGYIKEAEGGQTNGLEVHNGERFDSCTTPHKTSITTTFKESSNGVADDIKPGGIGLLERYLKTTQNGEQNLADVSQEDPGSQEILKRERTFNQFLNDTGSVSSDSQECLTAGEESQDSSNEHDGLSTGERNGR
ncbi:hypothetical protein CRM22_001829 [Opisthorchis felineus]|uniref:Uncharacterized protein n=1 Tax=Opisthorchis felineus TaxID=147828 RepID=A0A4S2MF47_OPIFE|nr:hypothetical protein CRM22_001829 [Opisthorchis felineus]